MYCSSCGVAVAQVLSYCNHCGAKLQLNEENEKSAGSKQDFLLFSMVGTFIFGLVALAILMGVMKVILGLSVETVLVFISVPFVLMLVLEAVFIRLLLGRNRDSRETTDRLRAKQHETNELNAAHAGILPEPKPSITEHTTRTFEPIYHDRTSK